MKSDHFPIDLIFASLSLLLDMSNDTIIQDDLEWALEGIERAASGFKASVSYIVKEAKQRIDLKRRRETDGNASWTDEERVAFEDWKKDQKQKNDAVMEIIRAHEATKKQRGDDHEDDATCPFPVKPCECQGDHAAEIELLARLDKQGDDVLDSVPPSTP